MRVEVAKTAGFCFGVRRAVEMVYSEVEENPGKVYTMGPIIHNEQVVNDLAEKGVHVIDDDLRDVITQSPVPGDAVIVKRSHGISQEMNEKLKETGCKIADATCPFVSKIHKIVQEKSRELPSFVPQPLPGSPFANILCSVTVPIADMNV